MQIGLGLPITRQGSAPASDPHPGSNILLESGENILLENGTDALLTES